MLAERYAVSGGDIKNAVLKAATTAASESGENIAKVIRQSHFERAMEEVASAKSVMQQSLFGEGEAAPEDRMMRAVEAAELRWRKTAQAAIGMGALGVILALLAVAVVLARTL